MPGDSSKLGGQSQFAQILIYTVSHQKLTPRPLLSRLQILNRRHPARRAHDGQTPRLHRRRRGRQRRESRPRGLGTESEMSVLRSYVIPLPHHYQPSLSPSPYNRTNTARRPMGSKLPRKSPSRLGPNERKKKHQTCMSRAFFLSTSGSRAWRFFFHFSTIQDGGIFRKLGGLGHVHKYFFEGPEVWFFRGMADYTGNGPRMCTLALFCM